MDHFIVKVSSNFEIKKEFELQNFLMSQIKDYIL